MMTAGIAQCASTTQRGEGRPTQPRAVLSKPQFESKMKYHTMATAAPDSTVGVNSTVRAPLRKRRRWLSNSASNRPSSNVHPTEPTVNVAVLRAICQKRLLVKTVKVSHSRHSRRDRAVGGPDLVGASARVAALTTAGARICRLAPLHTLTMPLLWGPLRRTRYAARRRRGSSASRTPSPMKLHAMTRVRMARPGKAPTHHWSKLWTPAAPMAPHAWTYSFSLTDRTSPRVTRA